MLRSERGQKVFNLIPLNLDGYMFSKAWDYVSTLMRWISVTL